jgi:hemerythrin superfamily protein
MACALHRGGHPDSGDKETIMAKATTPASRKRKSGPGNALDILKADHKKVSTLFAQYEKAKEDDERKQELAGMACTELTIHAQIEEELFYPALRDALDDEELLDEAEVEHGSVKELVSAIQSSGPDDRLYDANVKVLAEYVKHHVKEEESEIFPKARKAKDLDLMAMGEEMFRRKSQLREEMGLGPEDEAEARPEKTRHSTTSRHI